LADPRKGQDAPSEAYTGRKENSATINDDGITDRAVGETGAGVTDHLSAVCAAHESANAKG
jgi:hypothetical protein